MSEVQYNPEHLPSPKVETYRNWLGRSSSRSAGTTLIELGIGITAAESTRATDVCSHCRSYRGRRSSTAEYPDVFCSQQCEQAFVRAALSSLTLEDCVGMHRKLEALLGRTQELEP
jgi:hypothetical protein